MAATANKFSVGQSVQFSPEGHADVTSRGAFTVTRIMPWDQEGWHYHVQSLHDRHTRRVHEQQLRAMPGLPGV